MKDKQKPRNKFWIARDDDGTLAIYPIRPKKLDGSWWASSCLIVPKALYPEVTPSNSPKELTISIKQ